MSAQPDHHVPDRPPGFLAHPSNHRNDRNDRNHCNHRNDRIDLPSLELVGCPKCDQPAEIAGRIVLESTGGPIEHVKIRCLFGHGFVMPLELLRDLTES